MDNCILPKDFYVYLHRKATTGEVFYVGKGKGDRALSIKHRNSRWNRTQKKHGLIVEIAQDGLQEWAAFELEKDLIALYGRENLSNMTDGGEGTSGWVQSEETKAKRGAAISAKTKGVPQTKKQTEAIKAAWANPEVREKLKATLANPELKEKHRASCSAAKKGKKLSAEHRKSLSLARLGKPRSEKTKQAISAALKGRPLSDKNIAGIRAAKGRALVCVENGKVFEVASDAVIWLKSNGSTKASPQNINSCCLFKIKSAYGYTWRYVQ